MGETQPQRTAAAYRRGLYRQSFLIVPKCLFECTSPILSLSKEVVPSPPNCYSDRPPTCHSDRREESKLPAQQNPQLRIPTPPQLQRGCQLAPQQQLASVSEFQGRWAFALALWGVWEDYSGGKPAGGDGF